jgi:hypothetical protein
MPAGCQSTESITFVVEPPPTIDLAATTPKTICQGGGAIDVRGTGFLLGGKVSLGNTAAGSTQVKSDMEAIGTFSGGFNVGDKLDLTFTNADGCSVTEPMAITVTPGPVMFAADPQVIYKPVATQVTLYLTSLTAPLGAVTITPTGTSAPMTLSGAVIDPMHPKHVLVTIPAGLAAGDYDVTVNDSSGCGATMVKAIKIVDQVTLKLVSIEPQFGHSTTTNAVSIVADSTVGGGFQAGARAYLTPHAGVGTGTAITSSVIDAKTLAGIVPSGVSPSSNPYDVIVVNPDGGVGVLNMPLPGAIFQAYYSEASAPPVIDGISPGSIPSNCMNTACDVTISGENFGTATPTVTETCYATGTSAAMTGPAVTIVTSSATSVTVNALPIVSSLAAGTQCFFRVANNDLADKPFADSPAAFVVASTSLNINAPAASPGGNLQTARRGAAVATGPATPSARFVYVLGGDDGSLGGALSSIEFAPSTLTGAGTFAAVPRAALTGPRTLAGVAVVGRYLFLVGGHNGTDSVAAVERAEILDPAEAPLVTDADLVPDTGSNGLSPGRYFYRVAALLTSGVGGDPQNPGGETLAGPEFSVSVPMFQKKIDLTIVWSGGAATQAGRVVSGYRVYRGTAIGAEDRYVDLAASASSFSDDGTATFTMQTPLPLGALGKWVAVSSLSVPRAGAAVTAVPAPGAAGQFYLYAGFGQDTTSAVTKLPITYDVATATMSGTNVTLGAFTGLPATGSVQGGRWLCSAYMVTPQIDTITSTDSFIYFGQGTKNLTLTGLANADKIDEFVVGKVGVAGALGTLTLGTANTANLFGYAPASAANGFLMIGGSSSSTAGAAAESKIGNDALSAGTPPAMAAWNANGPGLPAGRFIPAATLDGAYIYVVGGSTAVANTAGTATNTVYTTTY